MTTLASISAWLLAAVAADTVAVAVQPVDDRAAFAIIDACNRALGAPRCVIEGSLDAPDKEQAPVGGPPITRVRIALSSAELERAAISFEAGGVLGAARILELEDSGPLEERYRAIGRVIAAALWADAATARDPPPAKAPSLPPGEPASKRFGLETALFFGRGLDTGDARWGLRTRALAQPFASMPISALFAVRLGTAGASRDQPTVRWTSLALGLQAAVPLARDLFELQLHAEGALQFVHASFEARPIGAGDELTERRTGVIAGVQLAWTPFSFWSLFAGGESTLLWPSLIMEVRPFEVAKEGPARFSVHVGQRLSF